MHDFTPLSALIGGGLIGLAASVLLIGNGRVAGISGIVSSFFTSSSSERLWRGAFLLGLIVPGLIALWLAPERIGSSPRSLPLVIAAGLLVGAGTRLGSGCTSGHGVCGVSRVSPRSIVATAAFVLTGMLTVRLISWLAGAS